MGPIEGLERFVSDDGGLGREIDVSIPVGVAMSRRKGRPRTRPTPTDKYSNRAAKSALEADRGASDEGR